MTANIEPDRSIAEILERDGYAVVSDALAPELVTDLTAAIASIQAGEGVRDRDGVYAIRNLLRLAPGVKNACAAPAVRRLLEAVLGRDAVLVRGLYLSKTPRANRSVPWHQDATVAVRERAEATGFGAWSRKAGVQHVMAPPGVLSAMLTLRLYLGDCGEAEGALRVLPGSHQYGRLPEDSIEQFTRTETRLCAVPKGGALAMRPLVLHRSTASRTDGPPPVIQLDFAARPLPAPLEWHEAYRVFA